MEEEYQIDYEHIENVREIPIKWLNKISIKEIELFFYLPLILFS